MVDNFYAYIKNRMRQMGYEKFSMEAVYINETAEEKTIMAQNQFYYLIAESLPAGLVSIFADNNAFDAVSNYGSFNFNYLQEFTGEIIITMNASLPIELEFIRVIPE
jgi:hypothetical protein